MTATDELRRLLDERGVEWWEEYGFTYWKNRFGYSCNCATGHESGMVSVLFDAKPEQAVEATLGRGTCHDANNRFNAWTCSECGATLLLIFDDYGEPSFSVDGTADVPHYCPNCGRRVVGV